MKLDNINLMEYWINSSDRDYESMKKNFEIKQYTWALFIGHLMIEMITQFNISARYEDYKNEFYDLCTEKYTTEQINNIEEVRTWLKELLAEK